MKSFSDLPKELLNIINDAYQLAGMNVTDAYREEESKDYGACRLKLDGCEVVFRVAKATPKKVGHFVTVWQRPHEGAAYVPFNTNDAVDFFVVSVTEGKHIGQFVFDKNILVEQGIVGSPGNRGKGAFRVYAPWVKPQNKHALKTQKWQARYFFSQDTPILDTIRRLFKIDNTS